MTPRLLAGLDLGGTFIKYGLVDKDGILVYKNSVPTPSKAKEILQSFIFAIEEMKAAAKAKKMRLLGVGVGSCGIVNADLGKITGRAPQIPDWEGTEVKKVLERATKLTAFVDNDANAMAYAEHRLGAGRGTSSGLYITVGTGIGSGIILNNQIWRGSQFAGAEIGHIIVVKEGEPCKCGKKGCLEIYSSTDAFKRYYGKPVPVGGGVKYIFDQAKKGDLDAINAVKTSAEYLACGIGSVMELLNPQIVVVGGGISAGGQGYFQTIRLSLKRYASAACLKGIPIRPAKLGNDAGTIGAALLSENYK